jgi:hypothetical protein
MARRKRSVSPVGIIHPRRVAAAGGRGIGSEACRSQAGAARTAAAAEDDVFVLITLAWLVLTTTTVVARKPAPLPGLS